MQQSAGVVPKDTEGVHAQSAACNRVKFIGLMRLVMLLIEQLLFIQVEQRLANRSGKLPLFGRDPLIAKPVFARRDREQRHLATCGIKRVVIGAGWLGIPHGGCQQSVGLLRGQRKTVKPPQKDTESRNVVPA